MSSDRRWFGQPVPERGAALTLSPRAAGHRESHVLALAPPSPVVSRREAKGAPTADNNLELFREQLLREHRALCKQVDTQLHHFSEILDSCTQRQSSFCEKAEEEQHRLRAMFDACSQQQQAFIAQVESEWQSFRVALDRTAREQLLANERAESENAQLREALHARREADQHCQEEHLRLNARLDTSANDHLALRWDIEQDQRQLSRRLEEATSELQCLQRKMEACGPLVFQARTEALEHGQQQLRDLTSSLAAEIRASLSQGPAEQLQEKTNRLQKAMEADNLAWRAKVGAVSSQITELWTQVAQATEAALWSQGEVRSVYKELSETRLQCSRQSPRNSETAPASLGCLLPRIVALEERLDNCRSDFARTNSAFAHAISSVHADFTEISRGHSMMEATMRALELQGIVPTVADGLLAPAPESTHRHYGGNLPQAAAAMRAAIPAADACRGHGLAPASPSPLSDMRPLSVFAGNQEHGLAPVSPSPLSLAMGPSSPLAGSKQGAAADAKLAGACREEYRDMGNGCIGHSPLRLPPRSPQPSSPFFLDGLWDESRAAARGRVHFS